MSNYKIYDNQKETARMVFNSINLGNKRIHVVAPTQSGKTGTVIHLAHLMSDKNFILTSGMMENHLYNQNSYIAENYANNIKAVKVHDLLKSPNPKKIVDELSIDVIVIDESHYGIGKESRLDKLIGYIAKKCPNLIIVWVGATGYQLIHSKEIDDTIQMVVPENYYGVNNILKSKKLIDNSEFTYLEEVSSDVRSAANIDYGVVINNDFKRVLNYFKSFNNGLGIIRTNKKDTAEVIRVALNNSFPYAKVFVATSDTGISDTVKNAQMISRKKRCILIVVQGLKAGVDLGTTKSDVRFVIETYKTMASITQGLVGRICGYHNNSEILIITNKKALELQASYEKDYRVINDDFLSQIFEAGNVRLASNFGFGSKKEYKQDSYYGGTVYQVDSVDDVEKSMFGKYNKAYVDSVKKVMNNILKDNGNYVLKQGDHPSKDDRLNTIQSSKFKNRDMFELYLKKMTGKFNFSSVFHRFANTSEGRRRGGLKGGVSNKVYAERIKVGILYDNNTKKFFLCVRDEDKTKTNIITKIDNKTIFNH